jgi:hypothetical protein
MRRRVNRYEQVEKFISSIVWSWLVLKRAYLPILVLIPLVAAAACTSNTAAAGPAGGGRGSRGRHRE